MPEFPYQYYLRLQTVLLHFCCISVVVQLCPWFKVLSFVFGYVMCDYNDYNEFETKENKIEPQHIYY